MPAASRQARPSCPSWCIVDHSQPNDSSDGQGSHFHYGPEIEHVIPHDDTGGVWSAPRSFDVQLAAYTDAFAGTSEARYVDGGDHSLTEGQLRDVAVWATERADTLAAINQGT